MAIDVHIFGYKIHPNEEIAWANREISLQAQWNLFYPDLDYFYFVRSSPDMTDLTVLLSVKNPDNRLDCTSHCQWYTLVSSESLSKILLRRPV